MKIAIPIHPDTGRVYGSFSNAAHFAYYTAQDGKIIGKEVVTVSEQGTKKALRLSLDGVKLLLCNKIEAKNIRALNTFLVQVIPSVTGDADEAANECALDFTDSDGAVKCSGNCATCAGCNR